MLLRRITYGLLLMFAVMPLGVKAADTTATTTTPTADVSITNPQEGSSVLNTSVQVSGKAPASTIVTVIITDTDANRTAVAQQGFGQVEGTATADSAGGWTYVPQQTLTPAQVSAQASYTSSDNKVISSKIVHFVIVNSHGSSTQLSQLVIKSLIAGGALLFVIIVFILVRQRRHRKLEISEDSARSVAEDEERTARSAAEDKASSARAAAADAENSARAVAADVERTARSKAEDKANSAKSNIDDDNASSRRSAEEANAKESLFLDSHGSAGDSSSLFSHTSGGKRYMKQLEEEAEHVEDELYQAAEQLEKTNDEVAKLRKKISKNIKVSDGSDAKGTKTKNKKDTAEDTGEQ